jgi:hypothetical protein
MGTRLEFNEIFTKNTAYRTLGQRLFPYNSMTADMANPYITINREVFAGSTYSFAFLNSSA